MKIANFTIHEEIYQGKHFFVYRAINENETGPCVLKVLNKKAARTSNDIQIIKQEYHFLRQVESQFVVKALNWVEDKDYAIIAMENLNGTDLKDRISRKPLTVGEFILYAVGITTGLADIHSQNIIHRDINPTNIILDSNTGIPRIIDFSIASKFDVKVSYPGNPEQLQGTLPYISPEQTGRMNRRVDQRSDLYSLGITFYEMITGRLPFGRLTPIEIVYDHLARDPEPPQLVNKQIPHILGKIVLKLLAKNPEERYQSAKGLKYDLEKFRDTKNPDFQPGEKDYSGKLQIPEKLYGREKEIEKLMEVYREVSRSENALILVTGYSGTGKSALVYEIHKSIARDRAYFISGKFEQLQRNIPYFAFIQAFNQFCQLLLTEKEETLSQWKKLILKVVGKLGKVLTDTIPLLESIIGKQPEVPQVGGEETKKRFNHVFRCFLQAICTREHPLVVFIDDLQWVDPASLNLMQVLIDKQNHYLLFISAYRDNEVTPTHPLTLTLEAIEKNTKVHTIHVKNLSLQHISEWLGDTLRIGSHKELKGIETLSHLIYQKTRGNAFFTTQFLENLYREELLLFDPKRFQWTWDIKEIQKQNITDNVVDLLVWKIQTFPPETQEVLKLAACIGNIFGLRTLCILSPRNRDELQQALEITLIEHLVSPLDIDIYKFAHDRIRQAAYSLISAEEEKPLHLKIGRLLLNNLGITDITNSQQFSIKVGQQIFDIVNHLNIGINLIVEENEKIQLARLNLESGKNAKFSGAYKSGASYIHQAISLLSANHWKQYYDLALAIYNEAVQTAYLCGNFEEMEHFVDIIIKYAHNIADTSVAYEYRFMGLIAQKQPQRAVDTLLAIFSSLGVEIPRKPGKFQTKQILRKTQALIKQK